MRPQHTRPTLSVGVDMDALRHYLLIHGVSGEGEGADQRGGEGARDEGAMDAAWSVALGRFLELFERLGVRATFYCVAEDLTRSPSCHAALARATAAGHEVGNHSWRHPYALTRLPEPDLRAEVAEGKRLLEEALGVEVAGFRAPGYHTSPLVQRAALDAGHTYESSAFPCAPYYIAKGAVLGLMRLRGRRSQSIMASPRLLLAPRAPYLSSPSRPYARATAEEVAAGGALRHFPISVLCGAPLIGTAFTALGPRLSALLCGAARRVSAHLTLELHAVDLLSLAEDGLSPLLSSQPDLRASLARKRSSFEAALRAAGRGAEVVTLAELARRAP